MKAINIIRENNLTALLIWPALFGLMCLFAFVGKSVAGDAGGITGIVLSAAVFIGFFILSAVRGEKASSKNEA